MGLLYPFPVSREEADFVKEDGKKLTLKTYGLPYIFWLYALCALGVIFFMFLAVKAPVLKLVALGDETDATLGYALLTFIGLCPVFTLAFFFYEKRLVASPGLLRMEHRIFALPVFSETFEIESAEQLTVEAFLDSPNVARMKNTEESAGFQNKGYFVLWLTKKDKKKILIDRHSRKVDLEKLKALLVEIL